MTQTDYQFVISVLWGVFASLIMLTWVIFVLIKCWEYIIGEDIQALKWFSLDKCYNKAESIFWSFVIGCILAFFSVIPALLWLPGAAALLMYGAVRLLRWLYQGEKLFNKAVRFVLSRH